MKNKYEDALRVLCESLQFYKGVADLAYSETEETKL